MPELTQHSACLHWNWLQHLSACLAYLNLPSPVSVPQGIVKQEPHLHTWEGKQVKVGQCLSETWKLI